MEPLFEIYVVWTHEHGIEPETFTNEDAAQGYTLELSQYAAYRNITAFVSRLAMTPSELLRKVMHHAR